MDESRAAFEADAVNSFRLFTAALITGVLLSLFLGVALTVWGLQASQYKGIMVAAGLLVIAMTYIPAAGPARHRSLLRFAALIPGLGITIPVLGLWVNGTVNPVSAIYPVFAVAVFVGVRRFLARLAASNPDRAEGET